MDRLHQLFNEYKIFSLGYRFAAEQFHCFALILRIPSDLCIGLLLSIGTYNIIETLPWFNWGVAITSVVAVVFRSLSITLDFEEKQRQFTRSAEHYEERVSIVRGYINTISHDNLTTIRSKLDKLSLHEFNPVFLPKRFEEKARKYLKTIINES